jgi:hypothetical protein
MRTPAGFECKYFYGDYYRGRSVEECRLLQASGQNWTADLCKTCPAPGIARANACEFLQLHAKVTRPFSAGFMRRVEVSAFCEKANKPVAEPQIGCGLCHPLPSIFEVKK